VFVSPDSECPLASVNYLDDKGKVKLPYLVDWKDVSVAEAWNALTNSTHTALTYLCGFPIQ